MPKRSYTIRTMRRQELDIAIEWAAAEGWNPGLYDADCFYAADHTGFLIGVLGDEPIATISVVKYGASFAFLGFYIVKPEYRGQGYGLQIWKAGLARVQDRIVGLDGVVAQQDNYKQSGFTLAYRNIRYGGIGGGYLPTPSGIVSLRTLPFDDVAAYDKPFFPDDRRDFLQSWIAQPHSTALGILRNRALAGYGVLRPCRSGYKLGPLVADDPELAERLFLALKAHVPEGAPMYLDTPAVNPAAVELAQHHHMSIAFETARMYLGTCPKLPLNRLFGVTSFELG